MQVESTSQPMLTLDEANEGTISAFNQAMNKYSQRISTVNAKGKKGHNTGQKGLLRDKKDKTRPFRTKGLKGHLFGSVLWPFCPVLCPFLPFALTVEIR